MRHTNKILDKIIDYIKDCTYIKEPDYTNVINFIENLKKGDTK